MTGLVTWLLETSLCTLLLACLVWCLGWRLRTRPAVQHCLWSIVLLKFLCPPILSVPLSQVASWFQPEGQVGTEMLMLKAGRHESVSWTWWQWSLLLLVLLWGMGALVVGVRQLHRWRRMRRRLGPCPPGSSALQNEVKRMARRMGVRPPATVTCSFAESPFLFLGRRLSLVWPSRLSASQEIKRSRSVIAHEMAHLRRRDHWMAVAEVLAGCIWWWNPVFHWVRLQLHDTAELACDACALQACPKDCRQYAELFLTLSTLPTSSVAMPGIHFRHRQRNRFERRMQMILQRGVSGSLSYSGLVLAVALGVLATPTWTFGQGTKSGKKVIVVVIDGEDEPKTAEAQVKAGTAWVVKEDARWTFVPSSSQVKEGKPLILPQVAPGNKGEMHSFTVTHDGEAKGEVWYVPQPQLLPMLSNVMVHDGPHSDAKGKQATITVTQVEGVDAHGKAQAPKIVEGKPIQYNFVVKGQPLPMVEGKPLQTTFVVEGKPLPPGSVQDRKSQGSIVVEGKGAMFVEGKAIQQPHQEQMVFEVTGQPSNGEQQLHVVQGKEIRVQGKSPKEESYKQKLDLLESKLERKLDLWESKLKSLEEKISTLRDGS